MSSKIKSVACECDKEFLVKVRAQKESLHKGRLQKNIVMCNKCGHRWIEDEILKEPKKVYKKDYNDEDDE